MNLNYSSTWLLRDLPSAERIHHIGQDGHEAQDAIKMEDPLEPFDLQIPVFRSTIITRHFPGHTVGAFLQFVYDIFQEPVTLEDLLPWLSLPLGAGTNRFHGYKERLEAGGIVRRIEVIGRGTLFEGVRDNVLLLD